MTYLPSLLPIFIFTFSAITCQSFLIIGEVRTRRRQQLLKPTAIVTAMTNVTAQIGTSGATTSYLENFRQASGLSRIYRCASTDILADILEEHGSFETAPLQHSERILLHETGLILDLRSESERDEERARRWTRRAPGCPFSLQDVVPETHVPSSTTNRQVLRINVLSPSRFMNYASDQWLTPSQKTLCNLYWIFDADKVHEMRIDALNERGLAGLYEVILETGGVELCVALQEITLHLEQQQNNVVIHCVQGKDRYEFDTFWVHYRTCAILFSNLLTVVVVVVVAKDGHAGYVVSIHFGLER